MSHHNSKYFNKTIETHNTDVFTGRVSVLVHYTSHTVGELCAFINDYCTVGGMENLQCQAPHPRLWMLWLHLWPLRIQLPK